MEERPVATIPLKHHTHSTRKDQDIPVCAITAQSAAVSRRFQESTVNPVEQVLKSPGPTLVLGDTLVFVKPSPVEPELEPELVKHIVMCKTQSFDIPAS